MCVGESRVDAHRDARIKRHQALACLLWRNFDRMNRDRLRSGLAMLIHTFVSRPSTPGVDNASGTRPFDAVKRRQALRRHQGAGLSS